MLIAVMRPAKPARRAPNTMPACVPPELVAKRMWSTALPCSASWSTSSNIAAT
jgi:hypothetical protein